MRGMNVEESCLCINHVWVDAILASPHTFMGGFWPTSKWTKGGIHSPPHGADITLRDHESYPYCNLGWDKPHPPFNPWRDFLVGDCVMVMPDTTEIEVYRIGALWLRKALTCAENNMERIMYGEFKVECWEHVAPLWVTRKKLVQGLLDEATNKSHHNVGIY